MAWSRTRKLAGWILLLLLIAVAVDVVAGLLESDLSAVEAAKAACQERGVQLDEMNGMKAEIRSIVLGKTAEIEFKGHRQDKAAIIHVTLRKPLSLMQWQVTDVREELEN